MILQARAGGEIEMQEVGAILQNDEARRVVCEAHADDHERAQLHVVAGTGNGVRQELERIVAGERRPHHAHRPVAVAANRFGERCPGVADAGAQLVERRVHVGANAVDMDVQLILRARQLGIDRQTQHLDRQRPAERLLDKAAGIPGVGEIIRGARRQQLRAFDADDALRRNDQILRRAMKVLEDRVAVLDAVLQVDLGTRFWIAALELVRHALVVHDFPYRIWIVGLRGQARQQKPNGRRGGNA